MQFFYVITNIGHHACFKRNEHLFRCRPQLVGNLIVYIHALMCMC